MNATVITGEPASPTLLTIPIQAGNHCIVNVTFKGDIVKTWELHEIIPPDSQEPQLISHRENCGGEMCQTTVVVGDNTSKLFHLTVSGYASECGKPRGALINLTQIGGTIGNPSSNAPSVSTYLYDYQGLGTDIVCITIICQVGIDPSTRACW